jgi:ribosomal protein S18 acetylase RimI-like enzyme
VQNLLAVTNPRIEILNAAEMPDGALAAFFRKVWEQGATAQMVATGRRKAAQANLAEPGVEVPSAAVLVDAQVVGYCSSLPIELWDGGASHPCYWAKGLMVLPEYRNGPIGYLVLKKLVGDLRRSVVLTVAPASVRLFDALGYANLGMVPNYLAVLRPGRLASRVSVASLEGRLPSVALRALRVAQRSKLLGLGAGALGLGVRAVTSVHAASRIGLTVRHADRLPSSADLDALWSLVCRSGWSGVARNSRYLEHRYGRGRYHFVTVRQRDTLRALAILQAPRQQDDERVKGLSLGALSDLVVGQGDSRAAILATRSAAALSRDLGGDAILASTPSRWMGRVLVSQAWVPVPGNLHFLVRETDPGRSWPTSLGQWWLMRGDGESDGAL